jgi:signal transduction histidine kinase
MEKLISYEILDTVCEQSFDDIVHLASQICDVPISVISLVDHERQWFKAKVGLGASETSRDVSFCGHAIHQNGVMTVPDATQDERFFDNPLVTGGPKIRFYAGASLITPDGLPLGTLCVIDSQPRQLSEAQNLALEALSRQVVKLLELRLEQNRLRRINDQKNEFFAHVAHDLRSPLAALEGLAELLQAEAPELPPETVGEYAGDLLRCATQTRELVDNLLDWARFDTDRIAYTPCRVDFRELAGSVLSLLEMVAKNKQIRLRLETPPDCFVFADPAMLRSLVHNLVVNAIKFSPTASTVVVKADPESSRMRISVSDQGVGLTPEKIAELNSDGTHKSCRGTAGETGSGLGVGLCQRFAAAHGSRLEIKSQAGRGSCFHFSVATL